MTRLKAIARKTASGRTTDDNSTETKSDSDYIPEPSGDSPLACSSSNEELDASTSDDGDSSGAEKGAKRVKAPANAYIRFRSEFVKKYLAEHDRVKKLTHKELSSIYSEATGRWRSLGHDEKSQYVAAYQKDMEEFKKTHPKRKRVPKKKKLTQHLIRKSGGWHRCSYPMLVSALGNLDPEKKKEVKEIGFGNLLNLKCDHLDEDLCQYLISNFDWESSVIKLGQNMHISLNAHDIHSILGLPNGVANVPKNRHFEDEWICEGGYLQPNAMHVDMLADKVKQLHVSDEWKRAFVLFACAAGLAPNGRYRCHQSLLSAVNDVDKIRTYNWSVYVRDCLANAMKDVKPGEVKQMYGGCLIYLQILYLMKCEVGYPEYPNGDRFSLGFWTTELVRKRISWEKEMGGFGLGQLVDIPRRPSGTSENAGPSHSRPAKCGLSSSSRPQSSSSESDSYSDSKMERKLTSMCKRVAELGEYFSRRKRRKQASVSGQFSGDRRVSGQFSGDRGVDVEPSSARANVDQTPEREPTTQRESMSESHERGESGKVDNINITSDVLPSNETFEGTHDRQSVERFETADEDTPLSALQNKILSRGEREKLKHVVTEMATKSPATTQKDGDALRRGRRKKIPSTKFAGSPWHKTVLKKAALTTNQDKLLIYASMDGGDSSDTLVESKAEVCLRFHLQCMFDNNWLNSTVINMMGHLLHEEQRGDKMRYYFDTRAVQLMVEMDLENCTRISERRPKMEEVWSSYVKYKKTDVNEIIKADLLFFPANVRKHWFLLVVNRLNKRVDYLCSQGAATRFGYAKYVKEFVEIATGAKLTLFRTNKVKNIPTESDGNSCGLFLMRYMERWNGEELTATFNDDPSLLRTHLLLQLLNHPLNERKRELYVRAKLADENIL